MNSTLGAFHFGMDPSGLGTLNSSCHSSQTVLRWFVALILTLCCILLHTVEAKHLR